MIIFLNWYLCNSLNSYNKLKTHINETETRTKTQLYRGKNEIIHGESIDLNTNLWIEFAGDFFQNFDS